MACTEVQKFNIQFISFPKNKNVSKISKNIEMSDPPCGWFPIVTKLSLISWCDVWCLVMTALIWHITLCRLAQSWPLISSLWLSQPEVSRIPSLFPDFFLTNVKFPWPTELTISQSSDLMMDSTLPSLVVYIRVSVAFGSTGCRGSAGRLALFVPQVQMLSARVKTLWGGLGACYPGNWTLLNAISCILWIRIG